MTELKVVKNEEPKKNVFIRALFAVTGFIGFFIYLPMMIAKDCFVDSKPIWDNMDEEL